MNPSDNVGVARVLAIFPSMLPSATIYIIKPFTELAKNNKVKFDYAFEYDVSLAQVQWADIILFSRNIEIEYAWILEEALARQIPTIYDLDDNFWEVPLDTQYGPYFHDPNRIAQFEYYLKHVDVVHVYNHNLLSEVAKLNHNVILGNACIDLNSIPKDPPNRNLEHTVLTYVTSRGKKDNLLDIFSDDLKRFLDLYKDKVKFVFWGEVPSQFEGHPAVEVTPIRYDYQLFLDELSSGKYDVGLAPILPTHFYMCKTDTKFRDYGACRVAGIYSNVEIYQSVKNGETGLLVENKAGAWYDAMVRLAFDREFREQIQENAYREVNQTYRQEYLENHWGELISKIFQTQNKHHHLYNHKIQGAKPNEIKVCLGGGNKHQDNFINVSRTRDPGVALVADLNQPLPIATNKVDVLLTNQSLENAKDVNAVIREIYRVAKHGSQVCIYSSYSRSGLESSNPQEFNEDTPGLWTRSPAAVVDEIEYDGPKPSEGVSRINQNPDLRCLRMEFFYTPRLRYIKNEQKRKERKKDPKVCDHILYQMVAVKTALGDDELKTMANKMDLYEPSEVTIRRLSDLNEDLKRGFEELKHSYDEAKKALEPANQSERSEYHRAQDLAALLRMELEKVRTALAEQRQEYESMRAYAGQLAQIARQLAGELDVQHNRRILRIIGRLLDRSDASKNCPPALMDMLDDNLVFYPDINTYVLQKSVNLQNVAYFSYTLNLNRSDLCEIMLAPIMDITPGLGRLGIEIISPQGSLLVQMVVGVDTIISYSPVHFVFPTIHDSDKGTYELRVFARDLDSPLYIYEWRMYTFFGLGVTRKAFCGFGFSN